jgi:putative hydrolase of HD superfamily
MQRIVDLLFQAGILKDIPRSGYHFLGAGRESVAEHCFYTAFIAFVMTQLQPELDTRRLLSMCLVHDLLEARTGDLNTVHKSYVTPDNQRALEDTIEGLGFGQTIADLIDEFERGETAEARYARDADQLAFIIDLKKLSDAGHRPPSKWLPPILERIQTELGHQMVQAILNSDSDRWWWKNTVDRQKRKH